MRIPRLRVCPHKKPPRKEKKKYPSAALHLKPSTLLSQIIYPAHAIPNFCYHISPSKLGWLITSNWVALKHSHSSDACRRILSHDDRVIHSSWWFGEEMQTRTEPRPLPVSWRGVLYREWRNSPRICACRSLAAATAASLHSWRNSFVQTGLPAKKLQNAWKECARFEKFEEK